MADKVIGFSIEVRGTDSQKEKMADLKREILDVEKQLDSYSEKTKNNIGAQKASAGAVAELETKLKALKGEYNGVQREVIDNAKAAKNAEGSYSALVAKNKELSATLRAMPDGFDKTNVAANKLKKEMFENTAKLKEFDAEINRHFRNVGNYPTTVNLAGKSMQELKEIVREYTNAAQQAADNPPLQAQFFQVAADAKAELKDMKELVSALDPDNRTVGAFARLGSTIVGAFTAAQAAASLFGVENENVLKTIQKLQSAQALMASLKELADAKDNINIAKKVFMLKLQNAETAKGIVVTEGATVAQRLWNLAVASSPWFILLTVLVAIGAAIAVYVQNTGVATEAEKARSRAIDGTIIKNEELRQEYNNHVIALHEVANAYKVLAGEMTEFEASVDNIKEKYKLAITDIKNETEAKLIETETFWEDLWVAIGGAGAAIQRNQERLDIVKEGNEKILAEELKMDAELAQNKLAEDVRLEKERQEVLKDLGKTETQRKIDEINRETIALLKNSKFTAEEQQAITRDANEKIAAIRQEDQDKFRKQQEEQTKKLKEEEEKRLQIIADNVEKIRQLNLQLTEGYIRLNQEGTEEILSLLRFKTNVEKDELRKKLVAVEGASEEELKMNQLLNERILQLDQLREQEEEKILADAAIKARQQKMQMLDFDEQILIAQVKRAEISEQEKQKKILEIQIEAAKKRLALLEETGDKENKETQAQIENLKTNIDQMTDDLANIGKVSPLAKMLGITDENAKLILDKAFEITQQLSDQLFNQRKEQLDRITALELEKLDHDRETQVMGLQEQLDQQLISQAQFNQQKSALDRQFEQRKRDIERENFERQKRLALANIGVDLAQEILKIQLNAAANPANAVTFGAAGIAQSTILTAAAVAAAALQAAAVASQKFEHGGVVLRGRSHREGGIPIEAEGDEIIMTKGVFRNPGLRAMASAINVAGGGRQFAFGGVPLPVSSTPASMQQFMNQGISMEQAAALVREGINSIEVFNPIESINRGQQSLFNIESENTF